MAKMKTLTINGKSYAVTDPDAARIDDAVVGENTWSSRKITDVLTQARKEYNQSFANAIRGTATGNPVCITDCSPVEHEMSVKVDVPNAKVTRYGKNLVDMNDWVKQGAATIAEDGSYKISTIAMNNKYGADSGSGIYVPVNGNIPIVIRGTVKTASPNATTNCFIVYIKYTDGTNTRIDWNGVLVDGIAKWQTRSNKSDPSKTIERVTYAWTSNAAYVKDFQIEVGQTATEYEPYVEPITYTADENGDVKGVMSVYPSTTLIAEDGTTVTAEYNKDTNKVIAAQEATISELKAALTALLEG